MRRMGTAAIAAFVLMGALSLAAPEERMYTVDIPATQVTNAFYVSNRAPLEPSPLTKLPIGAIRPEGWLRHQLELMADGMIGHLPEISPWCRAEGSAWMSPDGEGANGWEEMPYWLKGFGDLGYVLADKRIIAEARKWIEAALASQEPDGYFGPRANKTEPDLWPNMIMLNVLQSYYEATGDQRVLTFMCRYFRWELDLPKDDILPAFWADIRGGDNLESIYWLYNRTGEKWLLQAAEKVHRSTANWTAGIASWHGVNICQGFREPAVYYVQSRDPKDLEAAERNYQTVMGIYGQLPGGMFGADEGCRERYRDPRQAAETCSMVEFMHSDEMLLTITGDPKYADRCEDVAFNSLPAAFPPDLKGLHYLTAPNMVLLDAADKSPGLQNGGTMLSYDPHSYRCCQHNWSHGWPYYAEHLWMATQDGGLAAVLYAACSITARVGSGEGEQITIREETDYPFSDRVDLAVSTPKPVRFPLLLRVPRWCTGATVRINGEPADVQPKPSSYIVVDRVWRDGDKVALHLPMEIAIRTWTENSNSVSVDRGPLTYSLKIGEKWVQYGGDDKWPAYEVYPTTPWNYGLLLDKDNPARSFTVVERDGPNAGQPFTLEAAPIMIRAKGKRIPEWQLVEGLVDTLQPSPVRSQEPIEDLTLIPMGCARLRISAFPVIGDGPDAHTWTAPPPQRHEASHGEGSLRAISDGVEPHSSNDQGVPRFTWWDHRGTEEWVTYIFPQERTVSECEVYWFDDTGTGECRVPASWKLLWKDGDEWSPVSGASEYPTARDRYNKVTFDPVMATGLKLVVQLQPEFSGGILEWRVGAAGH
jgi:hypothetical protein